MVTNKKHKLMSHLLGATAITFSMIGIAAAQSAATIPAGANTEPETGPVGGLGFSLSLDGQTVVGDPQFEDRIRRTDIALAQADVQVTFDGFDPNPRLNIEVADPSRAYGAGDTVVLRSETNYPLFIARGEMRIFDRSAFGGARLVATVPVDANGEAALTLPEGGDLVAVHRVYDANGRFDETEPLPLSRPDDRGLTANADGADFTAKRNIRVHGGTVTVAATSVSPGATLYTLGEAVRADRAGRIVLQRILPAGQYDVDVTVSGAGQNTNLSRPVTVPGSEWFYVAVADLTYGAYRTDGAETEQRAEGRLQFFVDGETVSGLNITSSLDARDSDISEVGDLLRRLEDKDPLSVLARMDPKDGFLTYGDDSTTEDLTPTSGRFYLKVEQDGNFLLWGDYKADISGSGYLRNERALYGLQAKYASQETTANGDARASAQVYASQSDQVAGREAFRGTGGSVYFLQQRDLTPGTETITVENRDTVTGRVIERIQLVQGRDYDINYIQGIITLTSSLAGSLNPNLIQTNAGGDVDVHLVAQYEYSPVSGSSSGLAVGGRAEAWVTDNLRVGATVTNDDTGVADQTAEAIDLRIIAGENSFVQLDYARSKGPGFGVSFSADGGLITDSTAAQAGSGTAFKIEGQADLAELGLASQGVVGGYYESREEGFSTLDYQVTAATGDETLYGAFAQFGQDDELGFKVYADIYENSVGTEQTELGVEISQQLNDQLSYTVAAEYLDRVSATDTGSRIDVAGRINYEVHDGLIFSVFGQTAAKSDGLDEFNRYGASVVTKVTDGWTAEAEISDGTGGMGGRLLARYENGDNSSSYFGYELDPGRAIDAGVARGKNGGKYILGGRNQLSDRLAVTAENTYDIFGTSRSLTGAYGVEYASSDYLTLTGALEFGQIEDSINGDFDRSAFSFGARYQDEDTTMRGLVELRRDEASAGSARENVDAIYVSADVSHKISEDARLVFGLDAVDVNADAGSSLNGKVVDASLGYAYRPVDNERLNVLASYRYLHDMFGQSVDGVVGSGPRQESHVLSVEANYDLTKEWTLGAKVGGRMTDSAPDDSSAFVSNDAFLGVLNARYELVRDWDVLVEGRIFKGIDAGFTETGALAAVYRNLGANAQVGVGYNFGTFSDDLTDLTFDEEGVFINLVAKF